MKMQCLPFDSAYVGPQSPLRPTISSQLVQTAMILPTQLLFTLGIDLSAFSMEELHPRMKCMLVIVPQ